MTGKGRYRQFMKKSNYLILKPSRVQCPEIHLPVFTTDFGKIGILICWDSAFPEVSRILALKGAEILFCPIWGDVRGTESWKITARSRAMDNGVYFVTSIFDGHSLIVNPAGDILAGERYPGYTNHCYHRFKLQSALGLDRQCRPRSMEGCLA